MHTLIVSIITVLISSEPLTELTGFLYQTEKGEMILSEEPNLPTCCQGSQAKMHEQVFVEGEGIDPSPATVVTLTGTLKKKGERSVLIGAHLVEREKQSYYWWLLVVFFVFGLGITYSRTRSTEESG